MKLKRIALVCIGLAGVPAMATAQTVTAFLYSESSLNPAFNALKLPPAARYGYSLSKRTQFHVMATPFMNGSNATLFPSPARADPTYGIGMTHAF